jgi:peptidoglycan/LPS O-acetylase OafA/YrhL
MRIGLLRKTGELSFGVYLVHVPMIVLFGSRYGFGPLQFLAAIAATFAAAAVLSALIEKPAIAFGREFGYWLLARRPASPAIPLLRGSSRW